MSLFFLILLFFPGCGTVSVLEKTADIPSPEEVSDSLEEKYQNSRFGYVLTLPKQMAVYTLTQDQAAIAAQPDSETVFLIENETNFFSIRGIENANQSAHGWLSDHLSFFYPTGDAAEHVGELDGQQAFFLNGIGTANSPARLVVLEFQGKLIVITYEQETETFKALLNSIRFLKPEAGV